MPLRWRLALLFAPGTAVVIATAGLLILQQLTAGLNSSLDATLRTRAAAQVPCLASSHGCLKRCTAQSVVGWPGRERLLGPPRLRRVTPASTSTRWMNP